jgi:hypothetical protein
LDQPEFGDLVVPGELYAKELPAVDHPVDLMAVDPQNLRGLLRGEKIGVDYIVPFYRRGFF